MSTQRLTRGSLARPSASCAAETGEAVDDIAKGALAPTLGGATLRTVPGDARPRGPLRYDRRERHGAHVRRLRVERERDVALHELLELGAHQLAPPAREQGMAIDAVGHGLDEALQLGARGHQLGRDVRALAARAHEHRAERRGGGDAAREAGRELARALHRLGVGRAGERVEQALRGGSREAAEAAQAAERRGVGRVAACDLDDARILEHPAGRQVARARLLLAPGGHRAQRRELPAAQAPATRDLEVGALGIGLDRGGRTVAARDLVLGPRSPPHLVEPGDAARRPGRRGSARRPTA